ncbi:MAG: VOC family protein [Pseudomonadota bacterium]
MSSEPPVTPKPTAGLRHVALYVNDYEGCLHFYRDLMGMMVEWSPDGDNAFLTSGNDNLALHRSDKSFDGDQHLDHIGFIIDEEAQVEVWHAFLVAHGVTMLAAPRKHRDGARSFYCEDPDGNAVQVIYHPPLSVGEGGPHTPEAG